MSNTPTPSLLPLKNVLLAISDITRWNILKELAAGEPLMATELADRLRRTPNVISKHLGVLRKTRVTRVNRRLNELAPHLRPASGQREIDFGHLVIRFEPST